MTLNFANTSASVDTLIVRIWPCNTWAVVEDIIDGEFAHLSDDYVDVDIYNHNQRNQLKPELYNDIVEELFGQDPAF